MTMKRIKYLVAVLCLASTASAQNLLSGRYNDGFLYRHDLNPAIGNEQNYVAMPALGNLNVSTNSNLRVSNVLFNRGGRTVLFLNPQVDAAEFLDKVKDKNRIVQNLRLQILGVGFKAWGGYNTIEINARENVAANVPGSLLRLAKDGAENKTYDISALNAHADAYAEIALGHSRNIDEKWRVGAKVKFLLGVANIDANVNKGYVQLLDNKFVGVTDAMVQTSLNDVQYKMESKMRGAEGEQTMHTYVNGVDKTKWGVCGFGMAFDLGAEYKIDDNWKVSMSLLDLGWIGFKNNFVASTDGEHMVETDKYLFNLKDDTYHSFDNEKERLAEGVSQLYELKDKGNAGSRSRALGATWTWGAEYKTKFYDKLTFAFLNTTRIQGKYSWTDFRFSANVAPTKAFSATANLAFTTFGTSFGWLINVHPTGFNFFLGMDHTLGKLAKQGLPLSGRSSINLGFNFPF